MYQKSYEIIRDVNEVIVQASHDTGACYGISKFAETVFKRDKMVREEGLQVLEETVKTMDPDEHKVNNFVGNKTG